MRFIYQAIDPAGRRVRGEIEAGNMGDLEMRLKHMDFDLISGAPADPNLARHSRHVPRRDLINFCFHLEQLTSAGVPILEGLHDLREAIEHPTLRQVTAGLLESIEGGQTLSQAMAAHPGVFSRFFVNLVEAGEASGQLPEVLARLGESLKWEDELAAQTKKLLLYPALVGGIVLLASLFLMIYMVPQLKLFVKNMGQVLPAHTRLLFFLSELLADYGVVIRLLAGLGLAALRLAMRHNPATRYRMDELKLRLPIIGRILGKIALARFASTFAMLYAAGIPVLEAITITQPAVGNQRIQQALQQAAQSIREGRGIAEAFAAIEIFPALVIRMLHIGENTGKLDTALLNISYFYNRDIREAVARTQTLIEPALTVSMGLLLGWIMLSVIGPIYDVISRIKM